MNTNLPELTEVLDEIAHARTDSIENQRHVHADDFEHRPLVILVSVLVPEDIVLMVRQIARERESLGHIDGCHDWPVEFTVLAGASDTDSVVVTVTPTDDAAPTISDFELTNPSDQTLEVQFSSDEPLAEIVVEVTNGNGDTVTTLQTDDFSSSAGTYTATFGVGGPGEYTVTLVTAADASGNDGASGQSDSVTIEAPNSAPTAAFTYSPQEPETDEEVAFDASGSSDSDGEIASYAWDFNGDGATDATGQQVTHTYTNSSEKTVTLTVTDDDGASDTATKTVTVTGVPQQPERSTLRIEGTGERAFYSFRATGDVNGQSITVEDDVEGSTATGAVGPGTDTFTFEGDLRNLYVAETANVFLNGNQINPDTYESVVSFDGDGSRTDYTFTVKNGEITGTQSLTGEDTVDQSSASGAVGPGSDTYVYFGTLETLDTTGGVTVIRNGEEVKQS